ALLKYSSLANMVLHRCNTVVFSLVAQITSGFHDSVTACRRLTIALVTSGILVLLTPRIALFPPSTVVNILAPSASAERTAASQAASARSHLAWLSPLGKSSTPLLSLNPL